MRRVDRLERLVLRLEADPAVLAEETLASEGISVRLLNMHTIKPLDNEAVLKAARETGAIVTAEDHQKHAGLGGAVAAPDRCGPGDPRCGRRGAGTEVTAPMILALSALLSALLYGAGVRAVACRGPRRCAVLRAALRYAGGSVEPPTVGDAFQFVLTGVLEAEARSCR